ncbi:MAG: NGG1p interacting factor NIF3 [Candidatus Staskawiczbacteria bacterium RIFOXYD2_FULL_37_9]|uniref:NGG1p interacting factor NIF3 n=1 Tax=Candidatus Staskawiczbacteria bacterium RIFOXYB1_FULL_37_44 TaxID=1802223 RepID=A0A1G2IUC3_9BACT|nr:MAG: NGG1p interacting factor NIF3 [Candidatus Staskawiczbacteria bacterium RIFOXYB1_FULL_37_44]OGZ82818.1 MAG: NGG1p interacting factor NIF3 [Candidatus Staskawiczbacteria bacterium RIFOXYC1_FULL_37_52]OGZ88417.1 MAG: NGG1p interacting factor NIF3 [Candidatus Staskawiczbacteria bacterium RIFOXYC2_FULL_37_19]OGZ90589.1 MAG: NGG1p interacting factor NIF3 [Candidatus Staskawiczbacteria bacterium RIFOXYD1_FULL_37_110]OGZ93182.1 MAG: NGG1p interacting factor NIF3 [Candidatus Staskawiczbacteria b
MKIQDIYNLMIKMGMDVDFRGREGVQKLLDNKKKKFEKLSEKEKEDLDKDALENPYLDSGVYNISDDKEIKRVLVGIDISPAEILIAKELGDIDLVIAHHPVGKGLAQLADVMDLQADVCNYYGVPINVAEGLMRERISEVARGVNSSNHQRTVDAAKLMKVNLMNSHTPCDNLAAKFLKNLVENPPAGEKPETVGELINILKEIPEYKEAMKIGVGPKIFVGTADNRCGKIALSEITGGTEGSPKLYEKMAQAGVGTVVGMHISEEHKKEAELAHVNIVIAGHISSDSLGVNLFVDELEKQGIEIVACSGFTRFSRVK